ncbi:hypothetical protein D3C85_1541400 [compost metagenome]
MLDSIEVGVDVVRTALLPGQIHSDLSGKRTAQVGGAVGERWVRPKRRRWFNFARGTQAHFVHVGIQVADIVAIATRGQAGEQQHHR